MPLNVLMHAGHNYIGTEHILLGLLREGEGVAARVLETLGADPAKIRTQVRTRACYGAVLPAHTVHTGAHMVRLCARQSVACSKQDMSRMLSYHSYLAGKQCQAWYKCVQPHQACICFQHC